MQAPGYDAHCIIDLRDRIVEEDRDTLSTTASEAWTIFAFDTPGLQIRPLHGDDEALYVSLYSDAEVMRHVGAPLVPVQAAAAFQRVLGGMLQVPPAALYWTLRPHGAREAVGMMALLPDAGRAWAELGLVLRPDAQGRGHASEAIAALQDQLSRRHAPHRLWTRHVAANAAATGLMRRMRFRPEPGPDGWLHWSSVRDDWPVALPVAQTLCHDPPPVP